ncbi:MAG: magnesium chelatase, partial [Anaerolineales bacterium]|nr:magnesium chelatase [Anaerolineales bacterium]
MPIVYPFTAIVGQKRMTRALILNAVDIRIGGVLIRGERGTAKSTAARSLAKLLPPANVVQDFR